MRKRTGLGARMWDALSAGVIICGLLSGCARTPNAVRDLPELPAEFARDLAVARTAPVLMTRPAATPAPVGPRSTSTPLPLIKAACTSYWDGYVVYPITVCYPPNELYETLVLTMTAAAPATGRTTVIPAKYFKLSSHPQVRIGPPWFCTIRGGPWYGHVEGAQSCVGDPNVRSFTAELLGAPEPVVVVWSGKLNDVPPPLNLFGITPSPPDSCVCCSGTMCPDGSCVPNPNQCNAGPHGPPALK